MRNLPGRHEQAGFFMADDLPKDAKRRDAIVLEAFGTLDAVCWVMDGNVYVR